MLYDFGIAIGEPHPPGFNGVVLGKNVIPYGATQAGDGSTVFGNSYSLTPPTSLGGAWTETTLHTFKGVPDGATPNGMALGSDGIL